MAKEILCGFGVDVDAVAGWLGSYGGEDSPDDISRGLFAGEVLRMYQGYAAARGWRWEAVALSARARARSLAPRSRTVTDLSP